MFCFAEIPTVTHKPPSKNKGMNTTIKWRKQNTTPSELFQITIEKSVDWGKIDTP